MKKKIKKDKRRRVNNFSNFLVSLQNWLALNGVKRGWPKI